EPRSRRARHAAPSAADVPDLPLDGLPRPRGPHRKVMTLFRIILFWSGAGQARHRAAEFWISDSLATGREGKVMSGHSHVPALRKRGRPTADELAAAAQVTKRTLYAYYGDKSEIFSAMVKYLAAAVSLDAASDRDTLETLAARIVGRLHSDELVGLHQLVIAESTRFPELALILHSSGDARHIARLAEHIR